MSSRERLPGLDVFRAMAVLMTYFFHSNIHMGYQYGPLTAFVSQGAAFMTGFYLLSGFVVQYTNRGTDLMEPQMLCRYAKKRFIGIVPFYWIMGAAFVLLLGQESWKENAALFPIEAVGLQSALTGSFGLTHNGGTWFISCLLFCYFLFPYVQHILNNVNWHSRLTWAGLAAMLLVYGSSTVVAWHFSLPGVYDNPFFRAAEFSFGVMLGMLHERGGVHRKGILCFVYSWKAVAAEFAALVCEITLLCRIGLPGGYAAYGVAALPLYAMLICSLSGIRAPRLAGSRLLTWFCERSYAFFLAQFYVWIATRWCLARWPFLETFRGILSFAICLGLASFLHSAIEKPLARFCKAKLL